MSTNIFTEAVDDVKSLENKLLGPGYNYTNNIKTPKELGMSSTGSIAALTRDITGLVNYVELLVTGKSKASKTGKPLGNKFFLKTGAKCTDKESKQTVNRYIYVNNVPDGSIPFISSALDVNFSEFKGLVPGTLSNVSRINPMQMLQSFMTGTNPECQPVTMETIDVNNLKGKETQYLTTVDIQNMSPCWFSNKKNPITKENCRETFNNLSPQELSSMPPDLISKIYIGSLGIFGVYLLLRLLKEKK
jgi:hypothetical protein